MSTDLETNLQIIEEFTQRLQVAVIGAEETTNKHVDWVEGPVDGTIDTANGPLKTLRGQIAEWRLAADQDVASAINDYDTQFAAALTQFQTEFDAYLITVGFEPAVEYAAGILIERRTQTVVYDGVTYYWTSSLPYTTTGSFGTELSWQIAPIVGGIESPTFTFASGGKLLRKTQSVLGLDGEWYYWTGNFPKTIAVASTLESAGGVGENLFKISSGFPPLRPTLKLLSTSIGMELNVGSFEGGATLTAQDEVLAQFLTGKLYKWNGAFPKVVDLFSTPSGSGGISPTGWSEIEISYNRRLIDESLRRSYAEAGYNVVGTFQAGFTYVNANDVGIDETTGKGFTGPAGNVAAGTNPASGGFIDISSRLLRNEVRKVVLISHYVFDTDTDCTAALLAAHQYANSAGRSVVYDVAQVVFSGQAQIPIKTNVDFGSCVLKPVYTGAAGYKKLAAFNVMGNSLVSVASTQSQMTKGVTCLPSLAALSRGTVFFDSDINFCKRSPGDTGFYKIQDINRVLKNGELLYPLNYDMRTGGTVTVYHRPDEIARIEIKGGRLDCANFVSGTLIRIQRNQVDIVAPTHTNSNAAATNIRELIDYDKVSDVTISNANMEAQSQPTTTNGTYAVSGLGVCLLKLNDVSALSGWGAVAFNVTSGIYANNCNLNRLDVHFGGFNTYVDGGVYPEHGIQIGCGGGDLKVHNIKRVLSRTTAIAGGLWPTYPTSVVTMRGDFGNYFDGDIDVQNITFEVDPDRPIDAGASETSPQVLSIVQFTAGVPITSDPAFTDYGFAAPVKWARSITVKDVKVNMKRSWLDSWVSLIPVNFQQRYVSPSVEMPATVVIDNVGYSGAPGVAKVCAVVPPELTKVTMPYNVVNARLRQNCVIDISNIISGFPTKNLVDGNIGTAFLDFYVDRTAMPAISDGRLVPRIKVDCCDNINAHLTIGGRLDIVQSVLNGVTDYRSGYDPDTYITVRDSVVALVPDAGGVINTGRTAFQNSRFAYISATSIALNDADYICGCVLDNAVAVAGYTASEMLVGTVKDPSGRFQ